MRFAAEWIGIVFFSIIRQSFYAGSKNHSAALRMFDEMEAPHDVILSSKRVVPTRGDIKHTENSPKNNSTGTGTVFVILTNTLCVPLCTTQPSLCEGGRNKPSY